jgi:hypothetical protein
MTKRDLNRIQTALEDLGRVYKYLFSDDILVCHRKTMKTTTIDFTNDQGEVCTSMIKDYGSPLVYLHAAKLGLEHILANEALKQEKRRVPTTV